MVLDLSKTYVKVKKGEVKSVLDQVKDDLVADLKARHKREVDYVCSNSGSTKVSLMKTYLLSKAVNGNHDGTGNIKMTNQGDQRNSKHRRKELYFAANLKTKKK